MLNFKEQDTQKTSLYSDKLSCLQLLSKVLSQLKLETKRDKFSHPIFYRHFDCPANKFLGIMLHKYLKTCNEVLD